MLPDHFVLLAVEHPRAIGGLVVATIHPDARNGRPGVYGAARRRFPVPSDKVLEVPCPFCGADDSESWGRENGWTAVRCRSCGLVYVNPRPDDNEIAESTRLGMHRVSSGSLDVKTGFSRARVRGFRRRLQSVFSRGELGRVPLRCLDVEAGYGELLEALRGLVAPGTRLEGIEPCRSKVEAAAAKGLSVRDCDLEPVTETYDLVSAINVLSHVPDPRAFVASLHARLVPGGSLLLVTGNGGDIPRSDYPQRLQLPDHLLFVGRRHVSALLDQAGFTGIEPHAFRTALPRSPLFDLAGSGLAAVLRRRVGYSGAFRSLWMRGRLREAARARTPQVRPAGRPARVQPQPGPPQIVTASPAPRHGAPARWRRPAPGWPRAARWPSGYRPASPGASP